MSDIQIVDTFCYNGDPIVELRLQLLYPVVDHFYIIESHQTFSGLSKPELYRDINKHVFEPYEDKITWIILDDIGDMNNWRYEAFQRNSVMSSIPKTDSKTVLVVCDADEIPSPETIEKLRADPPYEAVSLEMYLFYYNFDRVYTDRWTNAYAISLDAVQNTLTRIRLGPKSKKIENAGWHCSYFFDIDNIIRKIESFLHQEYNSDYYKNRQHISDCIKNGSDLYKRGNITFGRFDTSTLPEPLIAFNNRIKAVQ